MEHTVVSWNHEDCDDHQNSFDRAREISKVELAYEARQKVSKPKMHARAIPNLRAGAERRIDALSAHTHPSILEVRSMVSTTPQFHIESSQSHIHPIPRSPH